MADSFQPPAPGAAVDAGGACGGGAPGDAAGACGAGAVCGGARRGGHARLLALRDECDLVNLPTPHRVRNGEIESAYLAG